MITATNCAEGTIDPYIPSATMPWNRRRALHLYKRLAFGATTQQVEDALLQNPSDLVDQLIDQAINDPLPPDPEWADWALSDYDQANIGEQAQQQVYETIDKWIECMVKGEFRSRLTLFWHNHFVTRLEDYNCPSYMYQYLKLLKANGMGNFKTFTHKMGSTPAMLMFLNGVQNTRFEPNENYARELYELFTLGQDNGYTQQDITETARALTGWNGFSEACAAIDFVDFFHDDGTKTIFGQTGNWNYDDIHDILFEQRGDEIAQHICTKIYRHFVSVDISESIVNEMAATFKANNFELAPVFRQLFKSEHFFDDAILNVKMKSPIDSAINAIVESEFPYQDYYDSALGYNQLFINLYFFSGQLGQELLNPIDVSGWNEDRAWINGSTLTGRWQISDFILGTMYQNYRSIYINFAKAISNNSNDAAYITQQIVDFYIPSGLQTPDYYDQALTVFKSEIPENYFEDGSWNLDWEEDLVGAQITLLVQHISRIPEYQLS